MSAVSLPTVSAISGKRRVTPHGQHSRFGPIRWYSVRSIGAAGYGNVVGGFINCERMRCQGTKLESV